MPSDKDQPERLRWQIAQEIGLRAQITDRMERAETAVDVLKDKLRVALHDIEAVARESNDTITRLHEKAKQQLADSLNAENATLARLKKTEHALAEKMEMVSKAISKCNTLRRERDELKALVETTQHRIRKES